MPRLLQKMEQTSSPTNSSLTSMNTQSSSAPCLVSSSTSPPPRKLIPTTSNYHNENSSTSIMTSPSIHSSEYSMKISEQSQLAPEHPAGPFHALDHCTVYNHPNLTDFHFVDSRSYDMEALLIRDPMSATDTYENSLLDCHMADADWLSDNMANSLWNMNEIM
jgi:myb proto-oncogene protein